MILVFYEESSWSGLPLLDFTDFIHYFLERREGREKERNIDVQEKHCLVASHMPPATPNGEHGP